MARTLAGSPRSRAFAPSTPTTKMRILCRPRGFGQLVVEEARATQLRTPTSRRSPGGLTDRHSTTPGTDRKFTVNVAVFPGQEETLLS